MKRVVLLGGGHAHLQVLQALAHEPLAGAELALVSPHPQAFYSGMLPGFVAGRFAAQDCRIELTPLAAAAGARWIEAAAVSLDTAARQVVLADGRQAGYDVLSIDTGAAMDRDRLPGAREHALFVRPVEHFVRLFDGLVALAGQRALDVAVVGAGAAGVELALALWQRLAAPQAGATAARIALVTGGPAPLAGHAPAVMVRAAAALARRRITVLREACTGIGEQALQLANGARLACDAAVVATGAEAPAFLRGSALACDERGFVLTGPTLQSLSHAEVFAAGDVASRRDAPHAKSGVHAVRAGPALALNLRRFAAGGELQPYQPPRRTLNLLACGDGSAIASWGGWSAQGRWVGRWKDRIDRRFVARFADAGVNRSAAP